MLPRGWAALVLVALTATSVRAQGVSDGLGIERFRVAIDRAGLLDVEWADVPAHLSWDAGVLAGFAHDPLVVYDKQMNALDALVERRLTTTLVGAVGLYDRAELGAALDVVGYQSGADDLTMKSLPAGGVGDLRLIGKVKLAGDRAYQVAVLASLTAPGGGARGFLREAGVTFAPALAISGRHGVLRGALNAGYLLRRDVDTAGLVSGDEGFARAAIGVTLGDLRAPIVEVFASASIASPLRDVDKNQVAIEALAGANRQLSPTLGAFVAFGVGLDNGFGTPDWRALAGIRFGSPPPAEPPRGPITTVIVPTAPVDRDGDGVADPADRCPAQKETANGFRDDDGCPEAPAQLAVRVVAPDGRAIAGVAVVIKQPQTAEPAIDGTTDDDGRLSHAVLGGEIVVEASAPEYNDAAVTVQVEPGQSATASVTLTRKVRQGVLRGQVLSFDGKPLAATITVTGKSTASATADAEGNYSLELPDGAFQVEIAAPGYRTQKRSVSVKLDGVTVLNIDLRGTK